MSVGEGPELVAFCREEYARLVGSLGLFCGEPEVAQELAQEALMRACRDWRNVRRKDSPTAWVHTIGMNLARSYFRRRLAERRAAERLRNEFIASPRVIDDDEAIAIRSAVAGLPSRQKKALVLRYYVDLPIAEIAGVMDCSRSTVKSLIRRALSSLRDHEEFSHFKEAENAV